MGILIAIEGTDSSGKQTQSELVYNKLLEQGIPARLISFPAYESESSALVKMYLSGDFGREPQDVNAYTASTFYAVDRFATYRKDWKKDYDGGTVIV
ncbi:MAG: dTMP kinase, partial [Candidatus Ornithomonoglobus sp.]